VIKRLFAFHTLLISYNDLQDNENALDSGKKCLEFCSIIGDAIDRRTMKLAFDIMRNASLQLKRNQDALIYAKKSLKIDTLRFNNKEIETYELLLSYHKLIQMHMTNGDFDCALKMIERRLTLFNLNSMNPNDVKTSFQKEGYGLTLTLNNFLREYNDDMEPALFLAFRHVSENLWYFFTKVQSFYYVAKICWQKHEIHFYCDDLQTNFEWDHMAWQILGDILLHFRQFTLNNKQSFKYMDNCLRNLN
jgi:tetratricopeptide (TPR) repeat protein